MPRDRVGARGFGDDLVRGLVIRQRRRRRVRLVELVADFLELRVNGADRAHDVAQFSVPRTDLVLLVGISGEPQLVDPRLVRRALAFRRSKLSGARS